MEQLLGVLIVVLMLFCSMLLCYGDLQMAMLFLTIGDLIRQVLRIIPLLVLVNLKKSFDERR